MTKPVLVFTPVNPLRPSVERLLDIHRYNVLDQNDNSLFHYVERECLLPSQMQSQGLYRGQNVVGEFNKVYSEHKHLNYRYICKWDDDVLLPPDIIYKTMNTIADNHLIGTGLFQEDYGAPNIVMVHPRETSFYGAFMRFYMYRMAKWGEVPVNLGSSSGDPDNAYQIRLKGKKEPLKTWSVHLDHRACKGNDDLYRLLLDWVSFNLFKGQDAT
jgi:hypothetical protein